jgi:Acetyltransferase (GNAT) domain
VVGTVAGLRYSADAGHAVLGWIALLLVDPSERRRGIGAELLQRALDLLRDVPTVMLDATPAGERLYRTLGFVEDSRLARLQRRADSPSVVANGAPGLATRADLLEMAALEGRVWGLNRYALVEWLREGALDYARVARDDAQRLVGFALGRSGHDFDQIGPLVAESRDIAEQLVRACLAAHPGRPVIMDVPDAQAGWRAWLESQGFSIQRPFTRMRRGPIASASTPSQVFATVGPEFG